MGNEIVPDRKPTGRTTKASGATGRARKSPQGGRVSVARRSWAGSSLALLATFVIVVIVGLVGWVVLRSGGASSIPVGVDGHRPVEVDSGTTVRDVLRAAGMHLHVGVLRTASGRVLDSRWSPPQVVVNGRPGRLTQVIRAASRIRIDGGRDAVEGAVVRVGTSAWLGGLPDVERDVWDPGAGGLMVEVVGVRSGEVEHRFPLVAPTPPSPLPGKTVALTFDDGPDPRATPRVLQILDAEGIKATFCVIGIYARLHPDLVTAIAAHGHLLCDHTDTHPYLDRLPAAAVDSQLSAPAAYLGVLFGHGPAFARAPYGALNPNVVASAHRQGLRVLGWSVDPSDYLRPPPATIVSRVLSQVHPGAIVLMHDGGGDRTNTVAALPPLIAALRSRGYTFVQPRVSNAASPPVTKLVTGARISSPPRPAAPPPRGTTPRPRPSCSPRGARPTPCPGLGE